MEHSILFGTSVTLLAALSAVDPTSRSFRVAPVPGASAAQSAQRATWGPWQPLKDGQQNAIDISYKRGSFEYSGGEHMFSFRLRNRYKVPVDVSVAVSAPGKRSPAYGGGTIAPGGVVASLGQYLIGRSVSGARVDRLTFTGASRATSASATGATYTQCRDVARYRDGRLAAIHRRVSEGLRVNTEAQSDLRRLRREMMDGAGWWDRMPATGNWAGARDGALWAVNTATKLATTAVNTYDLDVGSYRGPATWATQQLYKRAPSPAEVVEKMLKCKGCDMDRTLEEEAKRRATGRILPEVRSLQQAINDATTSALNINALRDTDRDRRELRSIVRTSLQQLDESVAAYAVAAAAARADLASTNAEQRALDQWIRRECADWAPPNGPTSAKPAPTQQPAKSSAWTYIP